MFNVSGDVADADFNQPDLKQEPVKENELKDFNQQNVHGMVLIIKLVLLRYMIIDSKYIITCPPYRI